MLNLGQYQPPYETHNFLAAFNCAELVIPDTLTSVGLAYNSCKIIIPVGISWSNGGSDTQSTLVFEKGWVDLSQFSDKIYQNNATLDIPSTVTTIPSDFLASMPGYKVTINIHKAKDSITGYPWGATESDITVNWLGE